MRLLLHRQSILYLLQPPGKRVWRQEELGHHSEGETGRSHPLRNPSTTDTPSLLERTPAQASASLCVASAQLQIETVNHFRPLRRTGSWWWDFHCNTFDLPFGIVLTDNSHIYISLRAIRCTGYEARRSDSSDSRH